MFENRSKFAVVALSAVFFMIDPLANVPVFLSITLGDSAAQRKRTAFRAALATWVTLSIFAFAGALIFKAFGISLGAFQIAGGIMLLLMSIDMVARSPRPRGPPPREQDAGRERDDVAIFPSRCRCSPARVRSPR
ncbi:MAG: hypothetical protein IPQ07_14610 [Myxococcales bacterium]|nr:hypothetical protein [Myxococcales bacterium]